MALFALFMIPQFGYNQITITNIAEIAKIKLGTTFFAMKDPASPKAAAYVDAIKKNWTLSKVECIKYTDVEKNIAPNNSFVTIGGNMSGSDNRNSNSETASCLELWTTNGTFVPDPKKRKHFNQEDKIQIATIELFTDFSTRSFPSSLYKMDYDANDHIKNWGDGVLGNYIQLLCANLVKEKEIKLSKTYNNNEEIEKLSATTLYIPDYVLTKFNKFNGDETKKQNEKDFFRDYQLSYKVISSEDLNTKIRSEKSTFYYLLLINSGNTKFITITNSLSGEIIYSAIESGFGIFETSDLKAIRKAILKK